jgi:ABC-type glycerol-3-phosphate transport system substrate-binding protein
MWRPAALVVGCVALAVSGIAVAQGEFGPAAHRTRVAVAGPGPGEIQVWAWNIAAEALRDLAPAFVAESGVDVAVVQGGHTMQSRLLLSLSAGVGAPDVAQLENAEAPFYIQTLRMMDLTAVAAQYEAHYPASVWRNCTYENKVYAIPWDLGPCAVFYRRGLFERYGIDPAQIETWDDYIRAGTEILARSEGKTKMLFLSPGQLDIMFEILLQQTGGQLFDNDGNVAVNSPEVLRVLELLRKMYRSGIGADDGLWGHAFFAALHSDAVATYPLAAWFSGILRDHAPETSGNWGVFRLPAFEPGGLRVSNYGGSVLVIPDQCKNKQAAWAFVEYALCTPEVQLQQYRDHDLFPALLTTHNDPFFDEPIPFFDGQRARQVFRQDIELIPSLNRTKDWDEAVRYVRQVLSSWVANGLGDPGQVAEELERRLTIRLGRTAVSSGVE